MDETAELVWYYAENGQQKGPVGQAAFAQLIRQGTLTPDTLVWRSGLAAWQAYGTLGESAAAGAARENPCHYCGKLLPDAALIEFDGTLICAACKPLFVQQLKENAEVTPPLARRYAGFWIRVGAKILDGILSGILAQACTLPLVFFQVKSQSTAQSIALMGLIFLISFTIGIVYNVVPLVKYGATPGKMACGLKVIRSDGSPLTYGRSTGRYFGNMLSGMILYIGYLMVAFDKAEHKALHDILCDTRVVYKVT